MNVKTYYPVIVSPVAQDVLTSLETFGFAGAHEKHGIAENKNDHFVLKDGNGNRVDVVSSHVVPRTFVGIRINVDDFDAAVAELTEKGYINRHPVTVESSSSRSTMMVSPEGVFYLITEHVK